MLPSKHNEGNKMKKVVYLKAEADTEKIVEGREGEGGWNWMWVELER